MEQQEESKQSGSFFRDRLGRARRVRPLTTDERASFVILSLYLVTFCVATFVYWQSLALMILGATAASLGIVLFVAAFFNSGETGDTKSLHPLRSYLISFFLVLFTLAMLRFVGGLITHVMLSVVVLYTGLIVALIVFRKAMIQVISAIVALAFLFVTFHNLGDILAGRMDIKDAFRQCGQAIFRIGPIQDVANMLMAGSYVTYLNRIDYRDEQIRSLASKKAAHTKDDDLQKTRVLLDFVSNDINYISDPKDGLEYAKNPIDTLIDGAGDCEDQALLLCSMLESIGVKTYMAFTADHVFLLVEFDKTYPELTVAPSVYIGGVPCYALDPADADAVIGASVADPSEIEHIFDAREKKLAQFTL
jgi:hypothetical protein